MRSQAGAAVLSAVHRHGTGSRRSQRLPIARHVNNTAPIVASETNIASEEITSILRVSRTTAEAISKLRQKYSWSDVQCSAVIRDGLAGAIAENRAQLAAERDALLAQDRDADTLLRDDRAIVDLLVDDPDLKQRPGAEQQELAISSDPLPLIMTFDSSPTR